MTMDAIRAQCANATPGRRPSAPWVYAHAHLAPDHIIRAWVRHVARTDATPVPCAACGRTVPRAVILSDGSCGCGKAA